MHCLFEPTSPQEDMKAIRTCLICRRDERDGKFWDGDKWRGNKGKVARQGLEVDIPVFIVLYM